MSADGNTRSDPARPPDDNCRAVPDQARPALIITHDLIEYWVGRVLTCDEMARLNARIATSPIPQVVARIVAQFDNEPTGEAAGIGRCRINNHRNDSDDWCPWSLTTIAAGASGDGRCPAGCASSTIEADDHDESR
ncbi:hypothetical protein [Actinoplanes sp. NPDC049316]|uniref:hypothetical protein n=1 Tax=Actinoplanes sp. NPDC049316 TaxID=3154727 RepID=UPI0034212354